MPYAAACHKARRLAAIRIARNSPGCWAGPSGSCRRADRVALSPFPAKRALTPLGLSTLKQPDLRAGELAEAAEEDHDVAGLEAGFGGGVHFAHAHAAHGREAHAERLEVQRAHGLADGRGFGAEVHGVQAR